jgi:hypothetical protein
MAMTNKQIIMGEILTRGIMEDVDTYDGWRRRGYQVSRGSKALFQTEIWKPCKTKKTEDGEARTRLYMVKASFFGRSQVEKMTVSV